MGLSQWDSKNLSKKDQESVLYYQSLWEGADAASRKHLNNAANDIRAKYGYSGGVDGSEYITSGGSTKKDPVVDRYDPPKAPKVDRYKSPYENEIKDIMEDLRNTKPYESPYEDLINQSMSNIINRPKFEYNADEDEAYQAFLQRAGAAGDKAYADNLGGLSAMTGGRANSWAGTVASQARNAYTLQAQEAVVQFEDRAYSRYRDEGTEMYNLVNMLNSQDAVAYGRYRDSIGDTKDLADMVFKLEDREFEQYKYMADQQWKVFDTEYQSYNDALKFKQDRVNEAIDRTNLLGYVNNQDSVTLGIPAGTLSQSARERAEQMVDYIAKQEKDVAQFRKEKEISHEFDLKLLNARESISAKSGGSGGGGSSGGSVGSLGFTPTTTEANKITGVSKEFSSLVSSKEFARLSPKEKNKAINDFIDAIVNDVDKNMYGKNSLTIGQEIISRITNDPAYIQYVVNYAKGLEIEKEIKSIGKPGHSMNDFLLKYSK